MQSYLWKERLDLLIIIGNTEDSIMNETELIGFTGCLCCHRRAQHSLQHILYHM